MCVSLRTELLKVRKSVLYPFVAPAARTVPLIFINVSVRIISAVENISSVQLLSRIQLFTTPWTAERQASLSITNSQGLLKLMSIESVMPSNHLILLSPSPPTFNLSQYQGLFK